MTNGGKPNSGKARDFRSNALKVLKSNIAMRAILIVLIVVLTFALLFSMTAAWYTNVAQTGGLMFSTETWDFDGSFTIGEGAISAEPGDEGYVSMQLKNEGETIVAASVTVSKTGMEELMKKRMYFYVESAMVRSGEKMDCVWVSEYSSYTYTAFPGDELVTGDGFRNIPALKWVWVYDVLGYYVLGELDEDDNVNVIDYVRPVVYDYDEIRTTFDEDGNLLSIDGVITVDEFLEDITGDDGYAGVVSDKSSFNENGYCPIAVNESGYGVWLYLCTRDEILANTAADTALSERDDIACTAQINLSGSNSRAETIDIANEANLQTALLSQTPVVLLLSDDIELDETLLLTPTTYAVIDMNGHTLTSASAKAAISAPPGAILTLANGEISGNGSTDAGIAATGASITLKDVDIVGVDEGITVFDYNNTVGADSSVYISGCNITGAEDGLWICGNGDASEGQTTVIIENSTINGKGYVGIFCNGTYFGTDIQITDSTVSGFYSGIYHPQKDSTLTVTNSMISGYTAIAVKGGTVNLTDCTVIGTGNVHKAPAYSQSGYTDTADGIYLEAAYEWNTVINIYGSKTNVTAAADGALAVRKYKSDASHADINIYAGSFDSDVTEYLGDGTECTESNGTYTVTAKEEE